MHSFAIISNSIKIQKTETEKILNEFKISKFDLISITDANNTIKDVRNAEKLLTLNASRYKPQALVVESIEKLSQEAQQALLKTLEEPPKNTIIIIEANSHDGVLPTILSRTHIIYKSGKLALTEKENKEITSFWLKIIKNGSISNRLSASAIIASTYSERSDLESWIDKQIIFFRSLLLKRVGDITTKKTLTPMNITQIIKLLIFSKKYNQANINMKLLIDHLFIHLPSLNE